MQAADYVLLLFFVDPLGVQDVESTVAMMTGIGAAADTEAPSTIGTEVGKEDDNKGMNSDTGNSFNN